MASQLCNFTLKLHEDMKANWEYFCETFGSYVTLMGYRPKHTTKEMAASPQVCSPQGSKGCAKNQHQMGAG